MYSLNKTYKFQLKDRVFYTGEVIEEDSTHIKIKTIKAEEIIILAALIEKAILQDGEF